MQQLTEFEIIGTLPTAEMPKELTIIEWLNFADAHGCVWAKSAIKQCRNPEYIRQSLCRAVLDFCDWREFTTEGEEYWGEIYTTLENHNL